MNNKGILRLAALMVCFILSVSFTVSDHKISSCFADDVVIPKPARVQRLGGVCRRPASVKTSICKELGKEAYTLEIRRGGVRIQGGDSAGVFYARQTLSQLTRAAKENGINYIPSQIITDKPRFEYRGVHIDVSRHFFSKDFILKQIDALAEMKINYLHLHLTDSQGWRLQIDKYPLLTEVAAWRTSGTLDEWWDGDRHFSRFDAPGAVGGFYTKDDVREIVAYAAAKHISVIPEIEMFAHSDEVLAVYPELSCEGEPYKSGEFCIGNEKTFEFIENVLLEVMDIFPSEYIHVGGDEASMKHWKVCPKCQALMKREGMQSEKELQSYGFHHIDEFLTAHGRKMIGWDEILDGGLAPGAAVMSWRGESGGRKAASMGHKVIMTPGAFCYLDKYQDDPSTQPVAFGGYLPLKKVYSYDPAPASMEGRDYVAGVQTNLWTEKVPTPEHCEFMLYPRVCALAEIAWCDPSAKDYDSFRPRAISFVKHLMNEGYHPFDLEHEAGDRPGYADTLQHLAVGCPVAYVNRYSKSYTAGGDSALTDGLQGPWGYAERWQGFLHDVDVTVDLGHEIPVKMLSASFCQWTTTGVYLPSEVDFYASSDSTIWTQLSHEPQEIDFNVEKPQYKTYIWKGKAKARYIRLFAKVNDVKGGWLFTDELIVE